MRCSSASNCSSAAASTGTRASVCRQCIAALSRRVRIVPSRHPTQQLMQTSGKRHRVAITLVLLCQRIELAQHQPALAPCATLPAPPPDTHQQ